MRRALALALLLAAAWPAAAERAVYKSVDADGRVAYSDRPGGPSAQRVTNWAPLNPSRYAYEAAVMRAESDRLQREILHAERRQPVPVVVYDPASTRIAPPRSRPVPYGHRHWRWDPNLPPAPAPALERDYYYGGR